MDKFLFSENIDIINVDICEVNGNETIVPVFSYRAGIEACIDASICHNVYSVDGISSATGEIVFQYNSFDGIFCDYIEYIPSDLLEKYMKFKGIASPIAELLSE